MDIVSMEQIKADEIIEILSNIIQKQLNRDDKVLGGSNNESKQKSCNLL